MKGQIFTLLLVINFSFQGLAQTNILTTNPLAEDILLGNYNPDDYIPSTVIDQPEDIIQDLMANTSANNIKDMLIDMSQFANRNTGSDTISTTNGIGAARKWAHQKFESFNSQNDNRLIVTYLQFDQLICSMGQHKNIMAVLPGVGPQYDEVVLIEAHYDSRCADACDGDCTAHGMEDNGSGSALVLELARVMSQFTFNRTIVFMLTIGEEQGLYGANALAAYCDANNVKMYAVLNNDIVGGIACGETASPPGCPGLNDIDSINVRLYSFGFFNSLHKGFSRFIKLQYHENMRDQWPVQTVVNIMSGEDRVGRGGDHIPFRQAGYTAVRFTSANEHGDAGVSDPDYHDRQHTEDDLLGLDTNGDDILDTFFVDFNYLTRNALLNGNAAAMAALGPITPTLTSLESAPGGLTVTMDDPNNYGAYRIGLRSFTNDFDTVYTTTNTVFTISDLNLGTLYYVSVASVDEHGIESLFTGELAEDILNSIRQVEDPRKLQLLQNRPNPFDDQTSIGVWVESGFDFQSAEILVNDAKGSMIYREPISLNPGMNEIWYTHDHHQFKEGVFYYSLYIDGKVFDTKSMVYAY